MQIQTVKTQEMNLLREQQEALTAELQQRRTEQESLLAQRDDLNSQLQVTHTHTFTDNKKAASLGVFLINVYTPSARTWFVKVT